MLKKIFSIFLDILLRVLQIKPILRILKRYKNLIVIFFSTLLLVLIVWLSTFSLSDIFSYKNYLIELTQEQPFLTGSSFFLIYMLISIISIPGITAFSLIGGLLFGLSKGMLICLFAVNIGSCIAFLITRYFLADFFMKKAGKKLQKIYSYLKKNEIYYLFAFRIFPFTPLLFTNLLMGLSSMKLKVFFMVSFLALVPILFVYVNMGAKLSQLENLKDFSNPELLFAFALIGLFPLIVKYSFKFIKKFKQIRGEFNLDSEMDSEKAFLK